MAHPGHPRRSLLSALVLAGIGAGCVAALVGPTAVARSGADLVDVGSSLFRGADSLPAAAPPPTPPDAASGAGVEDGGKQAGIVEAEDVRLNRIVAGRPPTDAPYEDAGGPQSLPTTVLTARLLPYDLPALQRLGAVTRAPDGSWLLVRSVVVGPGAQLLVRAPGATLRMSSGPAGFTSIVAAKGTLVLAGDDTAPLTVTSWDPTVGAVDTDATDGRSYLRAVGSRMELSDVDVTGLGFWSGRTGGLAWTGGSTEPSTGSVTDTAVDGNHYGVFSSRTTGFVLRDTVLRDNELDGLLVHRATTGLTAQNVTSTGNGGDGVAVVRGATRVTLADTTASANAGDGIRIDGTPLADDATAGGASTVRGSTYTVQGSVAVDNAGSGILATSADDVALTGNTVAGNVDGIVVRGPATGTRIAGNTVDAAAFGIAVRGGVGGAEVTGNTVRSAVIGLHITDSAADVDANSVTASRYGISLVGGVGDTAVTDNALDGRGLAAVDLNRVSPTATTDVTGNDDDSWVTVRDQVGYWRSYARDHPLLALWLLIVLLPVAARLRARRRGDRAVAHPYQNTAPGPYRWIGADEPAPPAVDVSTVDTTGVAAVDIPAPRAEAGTRLTVLAGPGPVG